MGQRCCTASLSTSESELSSLPLTSNHQSPSVISAWPKIKKQKPQESSVAEHPCGKAAVRGAAGCTTLQSTLPNSAALGTAPARAPTSPWQRGNRSHSGGQNRMLQPQMAAELLLKMPTEITGKNKEPVAGRDALRSPELLFHLPACG